MALKAKEQAFVEHYLTTWNGAEAARLAGYSKRTAKEQASRLLTKVNIQEAIQERLAALKMGADEVLVRLAEHARGTADDFVTIERVKRRDPQIVPAPTEEEPDAVQIVEGPEYEVVEVRLDLEKAKARNKLHLLKEYKVDKDGATTVKWHDAQAALLAQAKILGLMVERQEITGTLTHKGYTVKEASPDAWDDEQPAE